jgi:3-dehydroquinate dehydratase-2
MKISIINGPNLNLLGTREKDVYGNEPFESTLERLKENYPGIEFEYFQSNIEGEIVDLLQKAALSSQGVILNAAGYTHTSVSIADAVRAIDIPVVEVHISNILAREDFRHVSLISPGCAGSIFGFGTEGYRLAVEYLIKN